MSIRRDKQPFLVLFVSPGLLIVNHYDLGIHMESLLQCIFLCIPLTGILSGELTYDNSNPRWHEVTVSINKEQTRRLIFKLNSTPEAIDFNLHLEAALEETLQSVGEKSSTFTTCEEVFDENVQTKERDKISSMMSLATPPPVPFLRQQQVMLPESPSLSTYEVPVELQQKGIPFSNSEMQLLAIELTAAIMAGDVRKAQEAVTIMAQEHVKVHISIDADYEERVNREQEISVTVHVEDRESPGLTLNNVKVRPSDTIYDLKCRFLGNYKFPLEVQKWIIGNRICADDETLSKCNVKNSGHTLYLYLLNARAANITREDYARQLQAITGAGGDQSHMSSGEGDYESLHFPLGAASAQSPGIAGQDPLHSTSPSQVQGLVQGSALRQLSASSSAPSLVSGTSVLPELIGALEISSELSSGHSPGRRVTESRQVQRHDVISGSSGVEQLRRLMTESVIHTQQSKEKEMGWECKSCTLINQPTRPGCEACGEARPADYRVPEGYIISEEERRRLEIERQVESLMQQSLVQERERNYRQLLDVENEDLVANITTFTCPICMDEVPVGQGVMLRECLHQFCRICLTEAVRLTEEAELKCPFQDNSYACQATLQDREVRALVSEEVYERYLRRSLDVAESQAANSYHCKTPDCRGWCIYEDLVNFFRCPVCRHENCLTCRAIHEGMDCKQYQKDLEIRASNDLAAKQTQVMLQDMVKKGEAMNCPQCQVIVQKKDGCDWIRCSICKLEICWVTKGPRWGALGEGDNSAGCHCRVGGRKCHPNCNNCH